MLLAQWTTVTLALVCLQQAGLVIANTSSLSNGHVLSKAGGTPGGVTRGGYHSKKRVKERSNVSTTTAKYAAGAGEFVPEDIAAAVASRNPNFNNKAEPTCDQLRAMWRLSKRHSRAAEVTNEIPHYSDPFAHGIHSYARQMIPRSSPSAVGEPTYAVVSSSPATGAATSRRSPRPVIYGRVRHAPDTDIGTGLRPFDALRVVAGQTRGGGALGNSKNKLALVNSDSPVLGVLSTSPAESTRVQSTTKNSFHHLREIVQAERSREQVEWNRARHAVENALEAREMAAAAQEAVRSPYALTATNTGVDDSISFPSQLTRPFDKLRYGRLQIPSNTRSETESTKGELLKAASILKELEGEADSGVWSGPKSLRGGQALLEEPTTAQDDENWYDGGVDSQQKDEHREVIRDQDDECIQLLAEAPCRTNADCLCANSGSGSGSRRRSRCHRGRCQVQLRVQYAAYDDYGLWHTEPVPSDQLGAWTRRRRTSTPGHSDDHHHLH